MPRKLYGNLSNRIDEGRNYNADGLIHEGDDITMYLWSDRHCYFVTKVIDQNRIMVREYEVVADQDADCEMGHSNWKYFKTKRERNEYLSAHGIKHDAYDKDSPEREWVFRRGAWYEASRYDLARWNKCLELAKGDASHPEDEACVNRVARFYFRLNDADFGKVMSGKEVVKYSKLSPISFGVRDYNYDWEF